MPKKPPKRARLWLNDGSCIRKRPERTNHVWSYDFVVERTHDGRALRMLAVVDEYTRECLAIKVARGLTSKDVLDCLAKLFLERGTPDHIRSACYKVFVKLGSGTVGCPIEGKFRVLTIFASSTCLIRTHSEMNY